MTLDGTGSYSPTGTPLIEYKWTIEDPGAPNGTATILDPSFQYIWQKDGSYKVTLTVTDSDGLTGTAQTTVTVGNGCTIPTSEVTTAVPGNWDTQWPATFHFFMILQGGNFVARNVRETDAGGDVDTCYFDGSPVPFGFNVEGEWTVSTDNLYGPDVVGWKRPASNLPDPVQYYRSVGRAPCHFLVRQQMQIQCPDGSWQNYGIVNPLVGTIGPNSVSSCRAGVCQTKRY